MAASRRIDITALLMVGSLLMLAVQVALLGVLLAYPDPPFDALPGQQRTDSRSR